MDPAPSLKTPESNGGTEHQALSFVSLDGVRIQGYLIRQPNPAPLIVHTHGYNDQYEVMQDWAARGFHLVD